MCADQNANLPSWQKRFINPNIGSQLLRFASQRSVGGLEVAHRVWDLLIEQRSKASRVATRAYLIALQRRDPDPARMTQVRFGSSCADGSVLPCNRSPACVGPAHEQPCKAGRVTTRACLIALQRRDPDPARMAQACIVHFQALSRREVQVQHLNVSRSMHD